MAPTSPLALARRCVLMILGLCFALNQVYRIPTSSWTPVTVENQVQCEHNENNQSSSSSSHSEVVAEEEMVTTATMTTAEIAPISKEIVSRQLSVPKPSNCRAIVQRMQEWNDCWRRHLHWLKQQPKSIAESMRKETVFCPVTTENGDVLMEAVGAPLYHWAFYQGQGFGRVVAHTVEACLTAFLLQRPCLVNVSPRDPFYTWRSFIQENSYRWDPTILHSMSDYADQIEQLAQALPKLGHNEWDRKTFKDSQYDNDQSLLFPMHKQFDKDDWIKTIQYYHANITHPARRANQVLFSPNWALAWFTRLPKVKIFPEQYQCNAETLNTKMQDAMYGPTDLAQQLHEHRYYAAATSGLWNQTKVPYNEPADEIEEARILRKHTTSKTKPEEEAYGAIHLRMHFINERRPEPISKLELVSVVRRCLKQASLEMGQAKFPKNWWLLSDNATMAVLAADGMRARQEAQLAKTYDPPNNPLYDQSIPIVNLYHSYKLPNTTESLKHLSSLHSNSLSIRGKFGQAELSGAIEDWMALYASKIAIVVHVGNFGTTGARGNGKTPRGKCGGENGPNDVKNQYFQIYF